MTLFRYRALTLSGTRQRGRMEATDLRDLEQRLHASGLQLINGEPCRMMLPRRRLPRRELIPFCYQLEQLLGAGVPPFESLAVLRDSHPDSRVKNMVSGLLDDIENGCPLSQAAARQPGAFSAVAVSLLRAGEEAGRLPEAVRDIGSALARDEALAAHARRIAIYPAIVASVLLLAVVVALTQVVPELEKLLRSSGQVLPLQTRLLIGLSQAVRDWGGYALLALCAGMGASWQALARSARLRTHADALILRLPVVGDILRKLALARFAGLFATLYTAGINVIDALRASEGATGNLALREGLRSARDAIERGRPISTAFEAAGIFPPLVTRMLALGEQTGSLDNALHKLGELYQRDVSEGTARLQAVAEPALTLLMGGLLLWIASAVLGPIYDIITRLPV